MAQWKKINLSKSYTDKCVVKLTLLTRLQKHNAEAFPPFFSFDSLSEGNEQTQLVFWFKLISCLYTVYLSA